MHTAESMMLNNYKSLIYWSSKNGSL